MDPGALSRRLLAAAALQPSYLPELVCGASLAGEPETALEWRAHVGSRVVCTPGVPLVPTQFQWFDRPWRIPERTAAERLEFVCLRRLYAAVVTGQFDEWQEADQIGASADEGEERLVHLLAQTPHFSGFRRLSGGRLDRLIAYFGVDRFVFDEFAVMFVFGRDGVLHHIPEGRVGRFPVDDLRKRDVLAHLLGVYAPDAPVPFGWDQGMSGPFPGRVIHVLVDQDGHESVYDLLIDDAPFRLPWDEYLRLRIQTVHEAFPQAVSCTSPQGAYTVILAGTPSSPSKAQRLVKERLGHLHLGGGHVEVFATGRCRVPLGPGSFLIDEDLRPLHRPSLGRKFRDMRLLTERLLEGIRSEENLLRPIEERAATVTVRLPAGDERATRSDQVAGDSILTRHERAVLKDFDAHGLPERYCLNDVAKALVARMVGDDGMAPEDAAEAICGLLSLRHNDRSKDLLTCPKDVRKRIGYLAAGFDRSWRSALTVDPERLLQTVPIALSGADVDRILALPLKKKNGRADYEVQCLAAFLVSLQRCRQAEGMRLGDPVALGVGVFQAFVSAVRVKPTKDLLRMLPVQRRILLRRVTKRRKGQYDRFYVGIRPEGEPQSDSLAVAIRRRYSGRRTSPYTRADWGRIRQDSGMEDDDA